MMHIGSTSYKFSLHTLDVTWSCFDISLSGSQYTNFYCVIECHFVLLLCKLQTLTRGLEENFADIDKLLF